jgi:hypothetical protein
MVDGGADSVFTLVVVEVVVSPVELVLLVFSLFPLQENKNTTPVKKAAGRNRDDIIFLSFNG